MAQVNIIGVLDDGSNSKPSVPISTVQLIRLVQYSTLKVRISVFYVSGVPVIVGAAGVSLTFTVKKNSQDMPAMIAKTCVPAPTEGVNICYATIVSLDTKYLPAGVGNYVYDVLYTATDGSRSVVVSLSPLVILPAVGTP